MKTIGSEYLTRSSCLVPKCHSDTNFQREQLAPDAFGFTITLNASLSNNSFAAYLCDTMQLNAGATLLTLARSASANRAGQLWLLPDCFYGLSAAYTSFTFTGIVIEEDYSQAYFSRFPSTLTSFSCNACRFKPTNAGAPSRLALNWTPLFSHMPLLTSLKIINSGLGGGLPDVIPANITNFFLTGNSLTGTIPSTLVSGATRSNFSSLLFNARSNQLTGSIPANLFDLGAASWTGFSFDVSYNQLNGPLPANVFSLMTLTTTASAVVTLSNNQLTGLLPSRLFATPTQTSGLTFDVSNNLLSGAIPADLMSGANFLAATISASSNKLTGPLPELLYGQPDIIKLGSTELRLQSNNITGTIPPNLFALSRLASSANSQVILSLTNNSLSGPIPPNLLNFSSGATPFILTLEFSNNQLNGSWPAEVFANANYSATAQANVAIHIMNNQLSGTLPSGMLNTTHIPNYNDNKFAAVTLNLLGNAITGEIPSDLLSSGTSIELRLSLNLGGNRLSGSIPSTLFAVPQGYDAGSNPLRPFASVIVNVSSNLLSGSIPPSLFVNVGWSALPSLLFFADSNALNGTLSSPLLGGPQISNMGGATFSFKNNQISGTVPHYFFFGSSGWSSTNAPGLSLDLSGNALSGTLPADLFASPLIVELISVLRLYLGSNRINGSLDPQVLATARVTMLQLDLSSNALTSIDPLTFANVSSSVTSITLTLDNNKLIGATLPTNFFSLAKPGGGGVVSQLVFSAFNTSLGGTFPTGPVTGGITTFSANLGNNGMFGTLSLNAILQQSNVLVATINVPNNLFTSVLSLPKIDTSGQLTTLSLSAQNNYFSALNITSDIPAYLSFLDVSNAITMTGTLPSALFTQTTSFANLNAAGTKLSGPFPHTGSNDAKLMTLDLTNTLVDFCSDSAAPIWLGEALTTCSLIGTNASSCAGVYPSWCLPPAVAPPVDTSCSNATRPSDAFTCVNGIWTAFGDVSTPTLTVPSGATQTVINGNLGSTSVVLQGSGTTIVVSGCANDLVTVTIELSPEELSHLSTKELQTLLTYNGNDSSCSNLNDVAISATLKGKSCKKVSAQKVATSGSLAVLFSVSSSACNTWWIVLASVLGGLVVIGLIVVVLLAIFVPSVRTFFRPYSKKRAQQGEI